jgi:hypothetical protein
MMKLFNLFLLLPISLITLLSCDDKPVTESAELITNNDANKYISNGKYIENTNTPSPEQYNNTKGFGENGEIITEFDCPDSRFFPPIDIKKWDKIPVVNGRFPTYAETMNGTSIHHYGEKANAFVKPYSMTLPKLAYHYSPSKGREEIVVVIQIAQTAKDTIVGYRYLTGGVGGSAFHDFRFLTDDEVKKVVTP